MAVDEGGDGNAEAEEPELGVLGDHRRAAALAVDVDPPARGERIDRLSEHGGVELVEALADRVRGVHHDAPGELADIVGEDPIGLEVDRGDGERAGQLDLELAEGTRTDRAAEARDRRLADPGLPREVGDGEAGGRLEIVAHRLGDAALGRAQLRLDPLDAGNDVDRRRRRADARHTLPSPAHLRSAPRFALNRRRHIGSRRHS